MKGDSLGTVLRTRLGHRRALRVLALAHDYLGPPPHFNWEGAVVKPYEQMRWPREAVVKEAGNRWGAEAGGEGTV